MTLRWIAPGIWMGLIFYASTGAGSAKSTSRIIGPFLRWVFGPLTDATVSSIQFGIRKTGHAVGYAVLAVLCWWALSYPLRWTRDAWQTRTALRAWSIASVYAITDELHQSFIPSRQGSALDVLLDACGAWAGLMLVRAICLRERSPKPGEP
ncbi:MAG: vanZ like family protein [Verrucomicrobia bacterium]|jgi:VanZ family protein|nr:vanZ like family protein [Verrucomicrobiota bacterium]